MSHQKFKQIKCYCRICGKPYHCYPNSMAEKLGRCSNIKCRNTPEKQKFPESLKELFGY